MSLIFIIYFYIFCFNIIYIYTHWFKVFVVGSIKRSNLNEAAVQPVLNGWTNEPLNRRPRRFVLRSGSKNYGCLPWAFLHAPGNLHPHQRCPLLVSLLHAPKVTPPAVSLWHEQAAAAAYRRILACLTLFS